MADTLCCILSNTAVRKNGTILFHGNYQRANILATSCGCPSSSSLSLRSRRLGVCRRVRTFLTRSSRSDCARTPAPMFSKANIIKQIAKKFFTYLSSVSFRCWSRTVMVTGASKAHAKPSLPASRRAIGFGTTLIPHRYAADANLVSGANPQRLRHSTTEQDWLRGYR